MTDLKKLRELAEMRSRYGYVNMVAECEAIIEVLDRLERYEKALEKIPLTQFWAEAAVVAREALEGGK